MFSIHKIYIFLSNWDICATLTGGSPCWGRTSRWCPSAGGWPSEGPWGGGGAHGLAGGPACLRPVGGDTQTKRMWGSWKGGEPQQRRSHPVPWPWRGRPRWGRGRTRCSRCHRRSTPHPPAGSPAWSAWTEASPSSTGCPCAPPPWRNRYPAGSVRPRRRR